MHWYASCSLKHSFEHLGRMRRLLKVLLRPFISSCRGWGGFTSVFLILGLILPSATSSRLSRRTPTTEPVFLINFCWVTLNLITLSMFVVVCSSCFRYDLKYWCVEGNWAIKTPQNILSCVFSDATWIMSQQPLNIKYGFLPFPALTLDKNLCVCYIENWLWTACLSTEYVVHQLLCLTEHHLSGFLSL